MPKYEVLYQQVAEAVVVIDARDEEDLADIMEIGDFDLDWRQVSFTSDIINVDYSEAIRDEC